MEDYKLLMWYMKGFRDELKGTSSVESDKEIENYSYRLGASHANYDDKGKSINLTNEEILEKIKNRI